MTHDLELEKRVICLCHSLQKTPPDLSDVHFYNTHMAKIYSEIRAGNPLQTDVDFHKGEIDAGALYECLEVGAFSELEMAPNAIKLIGLYNKRSKILEAEKALESAKKADAELCVDKQDGFDEFMDQIDQIGNNEFALVETPWYKLNEDSRFTEGKSICFIVGDPGCSKSFMMTQLFGMLAVNGVKAIQWQAENDKQFHVRRSIAQYVGDSRLCDYEYLRKNVENAKRVYYLNREMIDELMKSVYSNEDTSKEALVDWCLRKAEDGYRVIGIDPLTMFSGGDKAHLDDQWIMTKLNNIIKKYVVTFIIVTHPRTSGSSEISLDNISGSRNLTRFCQNVIWLSRRDEEHVNRVAYTLKTRNGSRKYGGKIEMNFCGNSVSLVEV